MTPAAGRHGWALLLFFLFASTGCGAGPSQQFPPDLADSLELVAEDHFNRVLAHGVTIRVVMPNGATWETALGLSYTDPDRPAQPSDRFRIGSITKTYNATVILQLVEEGVLSLDDPLDKWVPGFDLGPGVTIKRLLSHTSGIFNFTDDTGFLAQPATMPEGVIRFALENGRVFEPGEGMSYSNTGYFLTGLVIEAATGQAFHEAVRTRLLEPLGLEDTYLDEYESHPIGRVDGHVGKAKIDSFAPEFAMSWAWAAGAMVANGADQCTWGRALLWPESEEVAVLTPESRTVMQTPTPLPSGEPGAYGTGLRLTTRGGRAVMGHTGSTLGFKGEMFVDQETGACVAISTNDFLSEPWDLSHAVWEVVGGYLGSAHQN